MPSINERRPEFFVDRSLGGLIVPAALRAAGWAVVTIGEFYGEQRAQHVSDTEWLELAGGRGWPVLLRDAAVLRKRDELEALTINRVRAFCLMRRHLTGSQQAEWFLAHGRQMMNIVKAREGPFMYGIYSPKKMEELWRPDRQTRRDLQRRR